MTRQATVLSSSTWRFFATSAASSTVKKLLSGIRRRLSWRANVQVVCLPMSWTHRPHTWLRISTISRPVMSRELKRCWPISTHRPNHSPHGVPTRHGVPGLRDTESTTRLTHPFNGFETPRRGAGDTGSSVAPVSSWNAIRARTSSWCTRVMKRCRKWTYRRYARATAACWTIRGVETVLGSTGKVPGGCCLPAM